MTASAAPSVQLAMMQKNEGPLLRKWLNHYSVLFGYRSLTILDNCSDDPETLALLDEAEHRGATVIHDVLHYADRSDLVLRLFKRKDRARTGTRAQFYIPVDCDEYLAVLTPDAVSCDPGLIHAELMRHVSERRSLQISGSFYNDPFRTHSYKFDADFVKAFFRSGAIETLHTGFHFTTTGLDADTVPTKLVYLHDHNKEIRAAKAMARLKLANAERYDSQGASANYLRWIINCGETEYLTRFKDSLRVVLQPGHAPTLMFPGTHREIEWNAARYLDLHPDVARHYPLGALHHFLTYGFNEGRQLGTVAGLEPGQITAWGPADAGHDAASRDWFLFPLPPTG